MADAAATQFFSKTYDETHALLVAARDYLAHADPASSPGLEPLDRLIIHCESLRLTARLAQMMAWLLAQKAVHAGEISVAEAAGERYRLSGAAVCFAELGERAAALPMRLVELLDQSRRLYVRVARLDELVRRSAAD